MAEEDLLWALGAREGSDPELSVMAKDAQAPHGSAWGKVCSCASGGSQGLHRPKG